MGWARLDDRWHDHPKVIAAGLDGAGLFAMCLTWAHHDHRRASANGIAPGTVPDGVVKRFAGTRSKRLTDRLREVGLFDAHTADGWPIHDYDDYLPKYDAAQQKQAGAAGGKARAARRSAKQTASEPLTEPASEPASEPLAEPQQTAVVSSRVPADATASAPRNPEPDPEPEGLPGVSFRGGGTEVTRANGEPPPRCPRHADQPSPTACGPCGDARRAHDRWTRDREQARRDAGPVVGGQQCPQHPGERAGLCGRCAATAVPMPPDVRDALRQRRAS